MHRSLLLVRRRLLQAIPVLLIVAIGVFFLIELAPGDAVDAYMASIGGGDQGFALRLREQWGIAGAWPARLASYLLHLVTLNFGQSVSFSEPVSHLIADRILDTLLLTISGLGVAAGLGTIFGVAAATRPGSWHDLLLTGLGIVLNATPGFFLALLGLLLFSVKLAWLPLYGIASLDAPASGPGHVLDVARHLVLPVSALGLTYMAIYQRLMRAGMLRAAASDYARTARAKGLSPRRILWRHMARNAILPVVTMVGVQSSSLLGGSVVIETVFAIPGFGRLAYEAVTQRDLTLLVGVVLSGTILVILVNLAIDLLYGYLDPRIEI
jgi:peptide/nickel transport system permease protein